MKDHIFVTTREALFIVLVFLLSRLLIVSAVAVSPRFVPEPPDSWQLDDQLLAPIVRWDAYWYLSIAKDGYSYDPSPTVANNIVFFPLYPLVSRWCSMATTLSIPRCGVLLSNLAFLIGLAGVYVLAAREVGPRVAASTVLLLAFFPGAIFFSTMYTESFYLAFTVLAWISFRTRRFLLGGIWAGLASATRLTGILLLIPLFAEGFARGCHRPSWKILLPASLLTISGFAAFLLYQWVAFHDPLAIARSQHIHGWRGALVLPFSLQGILWPMRKVLAGLKRTFDGGLIVDPIDAWMVILFVVLSLGVLAKISPSYAWYVLLSVAAPLMTQAGLASLTRYVSVLFPGFIALGITTQRRRWLFWACLASFALWLFEFSMRFARWRFVG